MSGFIEVFSGFESESLNKKTENNNSSIGSFTLSEVTDSSDNISQI